MKILHALAVIATSFTISTSNAVNSSTSSSAGSILGTDTPVYLVFDNQTSIPLTFEYDSSKSNCWIKKDFDKTTVQPSAKSSKIKTEMSEKWDTSCGWSKSYSLGITISGTVGGNAFSHSCSFSTNAADQKPEGNCSFADDAKNEYKVKVSNDVNESISTTTTFTISE
jgi:hypothetical protein